MEHATYFTTIDDLVASTASCDRLYFGHEFCQRLLPSEADLQRAMDTAAERECAFTFVTPFVTNAGMKRIKELVAVLAANTSERSDEIVVNDFGALHLLRRGYPEIPLVLGRLLTKQKRGPRLLRIADRMPEAAVTHFQRANVDVPHTAAFLRKTGIQRVELDNLLQGIRRSNGLPASLYYPYGYISTTRLCLMMHGDRPGKNLRSLGTCRRECQHYDATLHHDDMPVDIHLKGNTQFFRNDALPDNLESLNIDRLVHTPAIPA